MRKTWRSFGRFPAVLLPVLGLLTAPNARAGARISDVALAGAIAGENITLTLTLHVRDAEAGETVPLVSGAVAPLEAELPRGFRLARDGENLALRAPDGWFGASGGDVRLVFAVRPRSEDTWRHVRFAIPPADVRPARVHCDRSDLEVRLDGALEFRREVKADGTAVVTAWLAPRKEVRIAWKPELRRLDAELVLACSLHTLASVRAGALRLDHLLRYQAIQGEMTRLEVDLPDVNVLQVLGEDIQDWRVEPPADGAGNPRLVVTLGRPHRGDYRLRLLCERPLPAFPCEFAWPGVLPREVIRTSGSLLVGADGAIKLQASGPRGLSQIDPSAFPSVTVNTGPERKPPARPLLAYDYAAVPFALAIRADPIVPVYGADTGMRLHIGDETATVEADIQIDIREAPLREVRLRLRAEPEWAVTAVRGRPVAETDVDIRAGEAGRREISVPFREAVEGPVLLSVTLERLEEATARAETLAMPRLEVVGARSQRGHIVAAAAQGLRLRVVESEALREVHTASTPLRVEGAQFAFRFRESEWNLVIGAERATPAIHAEVLHLASLGAGMAYGSAAMTCHVSGAPVRVFRFHVPEALANLDVVGPGIDRWSRSNSVCTVRLTRRVLGDVTLLLTYDEAFDYAGAELRLGRIATLGTDSEMGFIVAASAAGIDLASPEELPAGLIAIPRNELPAGYAAAITTPILAVFRYLKPPGELRVRVTPLPAARRIDQVAEIVTLHTRISRGGEIVTTARYDIKNATRQFLRLRLPEGATLWSVRRFDEDDGLVDLPAQQTDDPRVLLAPVDRPRDPDRPIGLQIVYAQTVPARGLLGRALRGYRVEAPQLPRTHATFFSWTLEAMDQQGLRAGAPGLPARPRRLQRGWGAILREGARLAGAILDGPGGRRVRWPRLRDPAASRLVLDRTLTVADDTPPALRVRLQPAALGAGSWPLLFGGGLLGAVLLGTAARRRRFFWIGVLGAGLLLTALAELPFGPFAAALLIGAVGIRTVLRGARVFLRNRLGARRRRAAVDRDPPPLAPDSASPRAGSDRPANAEGFIRPGGVLLLGATAGLLLASAALAKAEAPPPGEPAPAALSVTRLALTLEAPVPGRDTERSAAVLWQMQLDDAAPGVYPLLPGDAVMLDAPDAPPRSLRILASARGYRLEVLRAGDYRLTLRTRHPVSETENGASLTLPLPAALYAEAILGVPAPEYDIASEQAALLEIASGEERTEARMALIPSEAVTFHWKPRARRTRLEEAVFFCEVDTLAEARPGVMNLTTRILYHIARGELREFHARLPAGVTVTSVAAPGIAAWSFDPATRRLEAILDRAVSSRFELTLGMQSPCEALPAALTLGAPVVEGAERQGGALAVAAPSTVQIRPTAAEGLTPINPADFRLRPEAADPDGTPIGLRRAYRYEDPETVALRFDAEPVPSELRVVESASLSLGEERTVLSSSLSVTIAKAGRFGMTLALPEGFDLESLSGADISQWDETRDATNIVRVVFRRRILGETVLNVVAARIRRGIPPEFEMPRLVLPEAVRHTGRLAVASERGVRLSVARYRGVAPRRETESAPQREDMLLFDILRPDWHARIRARVLDPVLKPAILHRVELAEGMLRHRIGLRYRIENAGVKRFRLVLPRPDILPTVDGAQVARVAPIPGVAGGWEVELHGRVEDRYAFTCAFNEPYDPEKGGVVIEPVRTPGTDPVSGYLVVTGEGRAQVGIDGEPAGLAPEDARGIPDLFQAGDLSAALHAFRIVRPDYRLALSVVRHRAADVLPATVTRVDMTSVLSPSGRLLTHLRAELSPGRLRTLRIALPAGPGELWTAQLNDGEVGVWRDEEAIHIPLAAAEGADAVVDLVVLSRLDAAGLIGPQRLEAPRFLDLPLTDIEWRVLVPPGFRYVGIGGDLEAESAPSAARFFSLDTYQAATRARRAKALDKARSNLLEASALLEAGKQREARRALQQTLNVSQAEADLNEDARVQMRNVVQEQVTVGLLKRREALRSSRNIYSADNAAGQELRPVDPFQGGDFDPEYARRMQAGLSEQERGALQVLAARFMDQQIAAAQAVPAIAVTLPEHGRALRFRRGLQTERGGDLAIRFEVKKPRFAFLRPLFQ